MTRPIVLDMLEGYERLKTEAAALAQLARDLYDGEEITPEAALRRLHQECMAAVARCVEVDLENRRLKAELEEQRLVVRAHLWDWRARINPEWHPHNRLWCRTFPDGRTGQVGALHRDEEHHTVTWSMGVLGSVAEGRRPAVTGGTSDNLREGMRAVEQAWAATASPRPPSPADGA